jgi:hypothetical protein
MADKPVCERCGAFVEPHERPAELRDMSINEAAPAGPPKNYLRNPSFAIRSV